MRYYIIYFLDYKKNNVITIKEMYLAKEDAYNNLERVAIDYIRDLQGKQQAEICKQDKTPEQLLVDKTIKEGIYFKKQDEQITIYEKITIVLPGRVWNSNDLKVNKIGQFNVTEYNIGDIEQLKVTILEKDKEIQQLKERNFDDIEQLKLTILEKDKEIQQLKEHNFDDIKQLKLIIQEKDKEIQQLKDILFKCNFERNSNIEVPLLIKKTVRPAYSYLDELKTKLESGCKLKPVN